MASPRTFYRRAATPALADRRRVPASPSRAGGGVGKSFLLLALAREVAAFDGIWANAPTLFGGALAGQGVAIYVTAEDDAIEYTTG